jgi:hypothetical protein
MEPPKLYRADPAFGKLGVNAGRSRHALSGNAWNGSTVFTIRNPRSLRSPFRG